MWGWSVLGSSPLCTEVFPAQNAGVRWASLRQAPHQQVATVLLLLQQAPKGRNHRGKTLLALRRVVKSRPLEAFMLLNPWGNHGCFPRAKHCNVAARGVSLGFGLA